MPNILVSITAQQQRALQRKARLAGRGSLTSEIRKAITQYLAGPRYIEAAFLKLLKKKAPKNLPAMLARVKETNARIDRRLAQLQASQHRLMSIERIALTEVAQMALRIFGSADKSNRWFNRPNRALRGRKPWSLLTSEAGLKQVKTVLSRIEHGVDS
jgi:putative toxin-antitoxin system antitoxin component (TIGR02293 family)